MKPVKLKSPDDIARISDAGRIASGIFSYLEGLVLTGESTEEIDRAIESMIRKGGGRSAFMTLYGYPHVSCISINDEIAHGIPRRKKIIQDGDLVKIDLGIVLKGYFCDACRTFCAGQVSQGNQDLMRTCREALAAAVGNCRPGNNIGDIGAAVEETAVRHGAVVVRDVSGHGTGFALHEGPAVPLFKTAAEGMVIQEGLVLAIEPALTAGSGKTVEENGVLKTADGAAAVQFEETVAVTGNGPFVLTGPFAAQ